MRIKENLKYLWRAWKHRETFKKHLLKENPKKSAKQELCRPVKRQKKLIKTRKNQIKKSLDEAERKIQRMEAKYEKQPKQKQKWNSQQPEKLVTYRRPVYNGNNFSIVQVPVTVFLTPNDLEIREEVEQQGWKVENPLKINNIVPEIYEYIKKKYYDYEYDKDNLGLGEWWMLPFETRALGTGDCEDWSFFIASYFLAAGVPSWRLRIATGTTVNGGGHATIYVLDDDMETWRHLNSTTPDPFYNDLSEYPRFGKVDKTGDRLGIHPEKVWEAFNDVKSWLDMPHGQTKETGNREKREVKDL